MLLSLCCCCWCLLCRAKIFFLVKTFSTVSLCVITMWCDKTLSRVAQYNYQMKPCHFHLLIENGMIMIFSYTRAKLGVIPNDVDKVYNSLCCAQFSVFGCKLQLAQRESRGGGNIVTIKSTFNNGTWSHHPHVPSFFAIEDGFKQLHRAEQEREREKHCNEKCINFHSI